MKKIIFLFASIMVLASCTTKVEKDIKAIVSPEFKVLDVKSVNIKDKFYSITEEYNTLKDTYEAAVEEKGEWISLVARCKVSMDNYREGSGWYNTFKALYDENKAALDSVQSVCNDKYAKIQDLEANATKGKVYIAKLKGKDELTGKYLDFNGYQLFAYNSDGSLHQVDTGEDIQMICSVYPKAKKDLEKAMKEAQAILLDAFSDIDF